MNRSNTPNGSRPSTPHDPVFSRSRSPLVPVLANSPPEFIRGLRDASVQADADCRLRIKVTGHPAPTVSWFKDGEELVTLHALPTEVCEAYDFVLSQISADEDEGVYSCEAVNDFGKCVTSCTITVVDGPLAAKATMPGSEEEDDEVLVYENIEDITLSPQVELPSSHHGPISGRASPNPMARQQQEQLVVTRSYSPLPTASERFLFPEPTRNSRAASPVLQLASPSRLSSTGFRPITPEARTLSGQSGGSGQGSEASPALKSPMPIKDVSLSPSVSPMAEMNSTSLSSTSAPSSVLSSFSESPCPGQFTVSAPIPELPSSPLSPTSFSASSAPAGGTTSPISFSKVSLAGAGNVTSSASTANSPPPDSFRAGGLPSPAFSEVSEEQSARSPESTKEPAEVAAATLSVNQATSSPEPSSKDNVAKSQLSAPSLVGASPSPTSGQPSSRSPGSDATFTAESQSPDSVVSSPSPPLHSAPLQELFKTTTPMATEVEASEPQETSLQGFNDGISKLSPLAEEEHERSGATSAPSPIWKLESDKNQSLLGANEHEEGFGSSNDIVKIKTKAVTGPTLGEDGTGSADAARDRVEALLIGQKASDKPVIVGCEMKRATPEPEGRAVDTLPGEEAGNRPERSEFSTIEAREHESSVAFPPRVRGLNNCEARDGDEDLSLVAQVEAEPEAEVTWLYEGKVLGASDLFSFSMFQGRHVLKIASISLDIAGLYTIEASNSCGRAEANCRLTVYSKPKLLSNPPRNQGAVLGSQVKFDIAFTGHPPCEVKWLRNGAETRGDLAGSRVTICTSDKESTLIINEASQSDAGKYSVELTNCLGKVCKSWSLSVPQISDSVAPSPLKSSVNQQIAKANQPADCATIDNEPIYENVAHSRRGLQLVPTSVRAISDKSVIVIGDNSNESTGVQVIEEELEAVVKDEETQTVQKSRAQVVDNDQLMDSAQNRDNTSVVQEPTAKRPTDVKFEAHLDTRQRLSPLRMTQSPINPAAAVKFADKMVTAILSKISDPETVQFDGSKLQTNQSDYFDSIARDLLASAVEAAVAQSNGKSSAATTSKTSLDENANLGLSKPLDSDVGHYELRGDRIYVKSDTTHSVARQRSNRCSFAKVAPEHSKSSPSEPSLLSVLKEKFVSCVPDAPDDSVMRIIKVALGCLIIFTSVYIAIYTIKPPSFNCCEQKSLLDNVQGFVFKCKSVICEAAKKKK